MQLGSRNLFHDNSWKPIYFWGQEDKGQGHELQKLPVWVTALLCVLTSSSF